MDNTVRTFGPKEMGDSTDALRLSIANHLRYSISKAADDALPSDWLVALSMAVRDRLVERWMDTVRRQDQQRAKRVYYLSMEFLPGRMLSNALLALGLYDECHDALRSLGLDIDELAELEHDPALGNGGLGRLAACFLDSMATLGIPGMGYGIRYDYGLFAQRLLDGRQVEYPDHWLASGNPWEFPRPEIRYTVQFGGRVENPGNTVRWTSTDDVQAVAYDTIVPGFDTPAVNTLRLWSATATEALDLSLFNQGNYTAAVEAKNSSENVSRVLYPDDSNVHGRELRLRQGYFFASASLQDMLRRHLKGSHPLEQLADKVSIHLNDTHPSFAVPELMRLLVDVHGVPWPTAWQMCTRIFSYTNHTLMAEALETWPVEMLQRLLPRHMQIIFDINEMFLEQVRGQFPGDNDLLRRVSLIDEGPERRVRMAHLSVLASHRVNGVSELHTQLLRETVFADFDRLFPGRIIAVTNGITPRRWLGQANPGLSQLLDRQIGTQWRTRLDQLEKLKDLAGDAEFAANVRAAKTASKLRLAEQVVRDTGVAIDPDSLFDVQIKRFHEYKRQLLNVLHLVTRYNRILAHPDKHWQPRTVIFAGKSASSYYMAKLVIKLINDIAGTINMDPRCQGKLKAVFLPNYGVSLATLIIPAADLSEQISLAGTEASGTGNMKLALNGALTIGTEDGANIEIRDAVGAENMFLFGLRAHEVQRLRADGYQPRDYYTANAELKDVLDQIGSGRFSPDEPGRYQPIVHSLLEQGDRYMLLADYAEYVLAQERVDALYADRAAWSRAAILNIAGMGPFSSDRAIGEYAEKIWNAKPITFQ